jgi:hypothetical protein
MFRAMLPGRTNDGIAAALRILTAIREGGVADRLGR